MEQNRLGIYGLQPKTPPQQNKIHSLISFISSKGSYTAPKREHVVCGRGGKWRETHAQAC